jgi:lipid-A-disaccharide synthase
VGRRTVLILTGEPSGDRAGGLLARELRNLEPTTRILAVGGPHLREAGAVIVEDIGRLSAMGFVEVLGHLPRLWELRARIARLLDEERPDVVVPIDYPDFHLGVAKLAKSRRIPVVYYIGPQIWAWRAGRITEIARVVDRMLVVFPFETELYEKAGVRVDFVGHPLLDSLDEPSSSDDVEANAAHPRLALLAGSRVQEVRRILPVMLETAAVLRRRHPELRVLVSVAPSVPRGEYDEIVRARGVDVELLAERAALTLRAATIALVTSGTATLEAALLGTPLAVLYRTSRLTWAIGRRVVRLPRISLVNILAQRELVPEFLQDAARPEAIADAMSPLLDDPAKRRRMRSELLALRSLLGEPGASLRAARIVVEEASR